MASFARSDDLENAITRYIAATGRDRHPKPFVCTATAKTIQAKLKLKSIRLSQCTLMIG